MNLHPPSLRHALAALVTSAVLFGCGVPEDPEPRAIADALATATPAPTATPQQVTEVQVATIYLLDANGRVAPVEREVNNIKASVLLAELSAETTPEEAELGLTTAVPQQATLVEDNQPSVTDAGQVTLDYEPGGLDALEGVELTQALAQIVWTLTGTNISSVTIQIDGKVQTWVTPINGERELLMRADFENFDPNYVPPPTPTPDPTAVPTPSPTPTSAPN